MPSVDKHIAYEVPKDILKQILVYFYIALAGELCSVFGSQILEKQKR